MANRQQVKKTLLSGGAATTVAQVVVQTGATFWMNPLDTVYQDAALTTVAADAESVGGVPDASGGVIVASQTLTARPTLDSDGINNKRCLLFTAASSQYLAVNALAAFTGGTDVPFSCMWVAKNINSGSDRNAYFSGGNSGSGNGYTALRADFNTSYTALRVDNAGTSKTPTGGTPDNNPHVMTFIFSGTLVTVRIDGVTVTNGADLDVGAITNDLFSIGAQVRTTIFAPVNGRMGHFVFWPRAISATEAEKVEVAIARDYVIPI